MSQKLPIGIQDFVKIREDGFLYVDKTARIHELLTGSGGTFFLSRPRRFGKSLLCSTMGAIFEGRRELFQAIAGQPALAIDRLEWDWRKRPVIRIDLNPGDYTQGLKELDETINTALKINAKKYGVPFDGETIGGRFTQLLRNVSEKYNERAAVIIDEYDKPLLSTIDEKELHKIMRNALKGFYGVLKSSDQYLTFVFLTGVTKFAQVSIFSELNNITDLTLDSAYYDLCGITQEELERDFESEIDRIVREKNSDKKTYLDELRRFYNGYRFSQDPVTVYNPFGLLNHFHRNGEFDAYWFATGTPTFLIKLIEEQKIDILNLENESVMLADFQRFDVENMEAVPVLYQSGYLTIVDYDDEAKEYYLDYPNEEVRASFSRSLVEYYIHAPEADFHSLSRILPRTLVRGDVDGALNAIKSFLASIPSDIQIKKERYYQTVFHLIFRMLGLTCRSEVRLAAGRIDSLVETKNYVYCFEFKLDKSAGEALAQIDSKDYLLPWQGSGKKLFKVGVNFVYQDRNIGEWQVVESAGI
ncbi:ATPase AAA [Spirochaetia bacterium]|nr:ATPase AAA [Spirochaetia bacterium]